jgi:hypothetical protein
MVMDVPLPSESSPEADAIREEAKPLLELLRADLTGTLMWRRQIAEQIVNDWVAQGIGWATTAKQLTLSVAEGIQQYLHDTFVDTTWPACPEHHNHPLFLHLLPDGSLMWECESSTLSKPLGSLTPIDENAPTLLEIAELGDNDSIPE